MCSLKTVEEIHPNCLYLEAYQTTRERNVSVFVKEGSSTIIRNPLQSKYEFRKSLHVIFVISGIVGMFLGLTLLNSFVLLPNSTSKEQIVNPTPVLRAESVAPQSIHEAKVINANQLTTILPNDNKPKYYNCLGSSNGQYMTIICPTAYGYVYKALVEIPSNLVSKFKNKIFSLRDFSVTEDLNSILIGYGKKIYLANFVTH